jgi:hypothetical protein
MIAVEVRQEDLVDLHEVIAGLDDPSRDVVAGIDQIERTVDD